MAGKDPLAKYNRKRDFARTPEPAGKRQKSDTGNLFIVQKHDATRLHWDFRLEVDGVLKSWAVTKGPSLDPEVKRLAVRTEDHPLSYAEFEGIIPEGEYGGGTVMLWDRGQWTPVEGKSADDIEHGHLHFRLQGERMKGEWLLVRMKPRPGEKRENWLLRKVQDDAADDADTLVSRGLTSVLTGRTMAEIEADKGGTQSLKGKRGAAFVETMAKAARHNARAAHVRPAARSKRRKLPSFTPVQLATLVDTVPEGNGWMHEIKFDGYRALAAVSGKDVRIYTRSGLDWTDRFAPIAAALAELDLPGALIDGEIVALDENGNPSFSALQAALGEGTPATLVYFAFDLLSLAGQDLRLLPNLERKEQLEGLVSTSQPSIRFADHIIGAGEKLFQSLCGAGQEGIVSKRVDAPYRGARTRNWVKVKCILREEFVILGWTRSNVKGRPFASLLLGQYEGKTLTYKGKVGTGWNMHVMEAIAKQLAQLVRADPPAAVPRSEARNVTWVEPLRVAEVAFAEFTGEGHVRHGSFVGLRDDKEARDVKPEHPAPLNEALPQTPPVTHRERVIFDGGKTKGDLADYYWQIAPLMLRYAAERPVSLVRCPQGRAKRCFFQKHDSGSFGDHVHHVPIVEKDGAAEDYLYLDDAEGILSCVQMGTIEFHGWASRANDVEHPDRMVFDLDPDEGLDFSSVKKAAVDIRRRLEEMGLVSFPLLSGGKGVHVVVPLTAGHDWAAHKDFSRRFAEALSMAEPQRFVATMSKAMRKGRIFIDWLRNQRGSTAIMPYSARARAGAPVAAPVSWDELAEIGRPSQFSIADAGVLLDRAGSSELRDWGVASQALPDF